MASRERPPVVRVLAGFRRSGCRERAADWNGYLWVGFWLSLRLWIFAAMDTVTLINTSSLAITPQMLSLIAELDEFKGAWRAIGALAPERLSALRRVATIESVGSSTRIEGSKLSDSDVERLLSRIEIRNFVTRDEEEVAGYAEVMEAVFSSYDAIALTENHIQQLHRDLLVHSGKDARHRGSYKTNPNHVSAFDAEGNDIGVVFETATPFDTPRLMAELVAWVNESLNQKTLHPLLVTAIFVVVFLEIHPFQDGNGRLSRVLTTLLLLRCGYAHVPYSSLESIIEASKERYYVCLRRTQRTIRSEVSAWEPWIVYFLQSLQQQKARLEATIARERVMTARFPELSVLILELARAHGRITNSQIVQFTGANRNTVKKHLQLLVSGGHLAQHGSGRATWYGRS
jgi:Fic family protein